jgi:hypothetical protein
MTTLSVSCDDCRLQGTTACEDCLVTFVLGRHRNEVMVIDSSEVRAMRLLAGAGLVPGLRYIARVAG